MLSNQMRGRAIRIWSGHPEKTSNIWHLVAVQAQALITLPGEEPRPESNQGSADLVATDGAFS